MRFDKGEILEQIDAIFASCGASPDALPEWEDLKRISHPDRAQRTIRAVALLDRFASPESAYRRAATGAVDQFGVTDEITLSRLLSALAAFRSDVEAGHAQTLVELVHANVFADFLEMAEELQAKSFKDPAAVITGSVLEEHLRKLGAKHGVATQDDEGRALKAERINASLAAAAVYNGVEQKSVTAWLGLRNKAAHGEYDEYDHRQVAGLIQSVRDFLLRNPA